MNTAFLFTHNPFYGSLNRLLVIGFSVLLFCGASYAGDLNLAWDASTSTGVGGYKLYYGQTSKSYTSSVDVGNVTTYKMTGLTEGSTYYFALKSYNVAKSIESVSYSNEINATIPTVPTTPTLTLDFTPNKTSGTAPLVVVFTPNSNQTVTSYNWDFGVPNVTTDTSAASNATYTYNVAGTYVVSLTATGAGGSATATKQIVVTVAPPPVVVTPPPVVTPPQPPVTTVSNGGLVAAYGFEEISGNAAADASGYGNHGVITEAARSATGYFGRALKFDGVNDWVTVNDSASLNLSAGLTLEAWVNPAVSMNDWKAVLMKEQPGDEVYSLYANNSNTNTPMGAQWINGSITSYSGGSNLAANTWWHLAATYDGQFQRLYVNGELVSERSQSGPIQQSNGALRIGGDSIWGEYFNGLIDEVRIYNRALKESEINDHYKNDYIKGISILNPPKVVVGENTLDPKVDQAVQGKAVAYKTTSPKPSILTAIQVYLDAGSSATQLAAGIYSDNAGHPGTLLSQGKISLPKAGATNTVAIPTVKLEATKTYWVAILGSKGTIKYRMRTGSTVPTELCATTRLTKLPTQWVSGTVTPNNGPLSAYGTGY